MAVSGDRRVNEYRQFASVSSIKIYFLLLRQYLEHPDGKSSNRWLQQFYSLLAFRKVLQ